MSEETAKFQELMNQGHSAAWDQEWAKALDSYRLALQETPDHPMALASAGLACFQLKRYDDALRFYQRCTVITPDDPMPFDKMGHLFERKGMRPEAVKAFMLSGEKYLKARDVEHAVGAFRQAIQIDPNNQTVRMRLAMIFDKMGLKQESITEYLVLAAIMQAGGDIPKAAQVVQYTLQLDPENQYALQSKQILINGQQLPLPQPVEEASGPAKMAKVQQMQATAPVQSIPNYDPLTEAKLAALKDIAGMLFEQGEDSPPERQPIRHSLHLLRGTGELSPGQAERARVQAHLSRTIDLQTAGNESDAAIELQRAIDLGLKLSAAEYLSGLLKRDSAPEKAVKHLQKSIRNPEYDLASYLLLGEIHEKAGNLKEAGLNYLQALKLADIQTVPLDTESELEQLYEPIFESQSRTTDEKKIGELCRAIDSQLMRPDWREYLREARRHLPAQQEGTPPIPLAEMLIETTNSQVIEALTFVKQLAAEGKLRTATEEAFHALTFAPDYLPLHIQIGELLVQQGHIHEAVEKFNVVSALYNVRGETAQAIRLLSRVVKLAPMDIAVREKLIEMLITADRKDDAVQQYMDMANVYYLLAELDQSKHRYQQALELSQKTSRARFWAVQILNKMADIELQSLDLKQAIRIMEQLRSIDPLEPSARSTLIDLYLRMGMASGAINELDAYLKTLESAGHAQKSEQFLDSLLNERPDNVDIQKRLIRIHQAHQKESQAIEKLDALAEKCLRQENREGALATLQNLIALDPPNCNDYRRLYDELKNQRK